MAFFNNMKSERCSAGMPQRIEENLLPTQWCCIEPNWKCKYIIQLYHRLGYAGPTVAIFANRNQ